MNNKKVYIKSILIPVIVGGIVGILISKAIDYNSLKKPFLAPPSILFPVMWTILYILMGISYGILENKDLTSKGVKWIYYIQLTVNALWPIAFFLLKWRLFAFIWIILLAILIITMIIIFYKKNKISGLLQVPYFLWTLFATYLNWGIYYLNK